MIPVRIGIMAALHDEVAALVAAMGPSARVYTIGQRDYYEGSLMGCECVLVLARIGKVAAAATAVTLIREFNAGCVIFAGLAGAVAAHVRVGDVVVARQLLQHDINASPLFPRYEVPLLGRSHFDACEALTATLAECATRYLAESFPHEINDATRHQFGVDQPTVHVGTIASGDCFVNDMAGVVALRQALPEVLCVEMEGAAVAQICHEYSIPCAVFRTISDRADDSAGVNFSAFLAQVASFYSAGILQRFLSTYALAAAPDAAAHR
ncbi:5'-methylthioadenosine/adenosylhomocysteine nucleosidase [Pusillimonas sp. ANT_WB101]|nr:5'-methylthioadenosine/adenosylhomocysteine nucleosidase [Pusillimonas sp. ANT_WB101]KAA0890325.1 5'-methylthioadenosine/adenosylhomocysteine nucleosidase [Pusillimonas sp. ANT_WB101]